MCNNNGSFRELNISARKQVNSFNAESAVLCVVTHDNKFLITAKDRTPILTKWSVRTKKELHTWQSELNQYVWS